MKSRNWFGDLAIMALLLCQVLDGALTYIGTISFGLEMEGNPMISYLMSVLGIGPGLFAAKAAAAFAGAGLHLASFHKAVALLVAFYVVAAVVPWTLFLF